MGDQEVKLIEMVNSNVISLKDDFGREMGQHRKNIEKLFDNDKKQDDRMTEIEKTCIKQHGVSGNGNGRRPQKTQRVKLSPKEVLFENIDPKWIPRIIMSAGVVVLVLKEFGVF